MAVFFVNEGESIQDVIDIDAAAGDTIIVGAGVFNEDININIDITVISLDGAGATTINGQSGTGAVRITADGATFGDTNHGFTVNAAAGSQAAVLFDTNVDGVRVEGNAIHGQAGEFRRDRTDQRHHREQRFLRWRAAGLHQFSGVR
jgi:pectin methylesterase-like acyl-CoA thioesterase